MALKDPPFQETPIGFQEVINPQAAAQLGLDPDAGGLRHGVCFLHGFSVLKQVEMTKLG